MDLVNEVVDCLKQNPEATLPEIFDPGLIKQLAAMPLQEYEKFRVHLEAAIILGGLKPKFSLGQLDKVVKAAAQDIAQQRSQMPAVPLGTACPNAPHAKSSLVIPGGFWLSPYGVGIMLDANTKGDPICESPVYISARIKNRERGKALLQIAYFSYDDKDWLTTYVAASAGNKELAKAIKNTGILVIDDRALVEYLRAFAEVNWRNIPCIENMPEDDLYADFQEYILEHKELFAEDTLGTTWGKFVQGSNGNKYIAIFPDVVHKFLQSKKADPQQTLALWCTKGYILPDKAGKTTRTVSFQGYKRRMLMFHDFIGELAVTEPAVPKAG